jgi:hypothetical protein
MITFRSASEKVVESPSVEKAGAIQGLCEYNEFHDVPEM